LRDPLEAPIEPATLGSGSGGLSGIATSVVFDILVSLVAVRVLLPALVVGAAIALGPAIPAAIGVVHAPIVLGLACILASILILATSVFGALGEVLVVVEFERPSGTLAAVLIASNARKLVATCCILTCPCTWRSADTRRGRSRCCGGASSARWWRSVGVGWDGDRR
jgi:hypothetical protein